MLQRGIVEQERGRGEIEERVRERKKERGER